MNVLPPCVTSFPTWLQRLPILIGEPEDGVATRKLENMNANPTTNNTILRTLAPSYFGGTHRNCKLVLTVQDTVCRESTLIAPSGT